ncbi:DUF3794 domain-containing protein [Anaerospora sp.]|uniref:DUF3794 domain-containing protein n=1 Tax=Anaerospora sp. TaxID=1960278 RepID=UPI00289A99B5|nr:DUF3794 domain-containing protein [Anaerospora sp.]
MDDKDMRPIKTLPNCTLGASTGPQTIVVRQVVAEKEKQKSLDIHVVVPDSKPAIEQIVDVFIKDVEINSVDVITDKVIVRGEFEIKAIYVACLPDRPVHAMEVKHYKWTVDIDMPGARRGMDAEATVDIEYVDYDFDEHHHHHHHHRAKKYTNYENSDNFCDDDDDCGHHHHHDHDCDDNCDDDDNDDDRNRCREFDVSVVLRVNAKVMADREVLLNSGTLPTKPKG